MFIKKEKGKKIKRLGNKYIYDPEYISARRTKRIELTTIFLCVFLFFSNIYLKSNYGGEYIEKQITSLKKKPQIIVATPGRLMDHMERRTVKIDKLTTEINTLEEKITALKT